MGRRARSFRSTYPVDTGYSVAPGVTQNSVTFEVGLHGVKAIDVAPGEVTISMEFAVGADKQVVRRDLVLTPFGTATLEPEPKSGPLAKAGKK